MPTHTEIHWIAFEGYQKIAVGTPLEVVVPVKHRIERGPTAPVLVFDRYTSQPIELDVRGTDALVVSRLQALLEERTASSGTDDAAPSSEEVAEARRGPGRRKLGVIAREVTLLPRHWEWLNRQPGGASAALRRLVDRARSEGNHQEELRTAQESAYRFMGALCGNLPEFEEATRALFAGDVTRFRSVLTNWPADVAAHASELAGHVFERATNSVGTNHAQ